MLAVAVVQPIPMVVLAAQAVAVDQTIVALAWQILAVVVVMFTQVDQESLFFPSLLQVIAAQLLVAQLLLLQAQILSLNTHLLELTQHDHLSMEN